jgi:geranylgeranyl diphosphate synthase type 3
MLLLCAELLSIFLDCKYSDILRQRTHDLEVKKYFITLLEKFGSFTHTRHTLKELDAEARAEVSKLGGNPLLEAVLDELLTWKRRAD